MTDGLTNRSPLSCSLGPIGQLLPNGFKRGFRHKSNNAILPSTSASRESCGFPAGQDGTTRSLD